MALTTINAQVEQGTILIGGMGGFNSYTSESTTVTGGTTVTVQNPKTTMVNLSPYFGYLVTESLAVGLGIGFESTTTVWDDFPAAGDKQTDKTSITTVTPGIRYYYVHLDNTHLFAHLGIPIGFGKVTHEENIGGTATTTESKIMSFGVGIRPGLSINVGEKCALEAMYGFLGYTSSTTTSDGVNYLEEPYTQEDKSSSFGLEWANTFSFGIIFTL